MKKRQSENLKIWCLAGSALFVSLLIAWWIGKPLVDLAQDPKIFQEWINSQGFFGKITMIIVVFVQIIIAWIPGEVFEIGAGFAFGFWEGSLLVLIGSFLASWLILFLVRTYGRKIIYVFFAKEKIDTLPFLQNQKRLNRWIFIAFLLPGTPKDILTYAIGLTNMKISHFLIISTIGRIPSVITSTMTGSAIKEEAYAFAMVSFIFTLIISAIGLYIYGRITAKKKSLVVKSSLKSKCLTENA